jgi:hypothetical protein
MGRRSKTIALDEPARLAPNDWSSVEVRMLECSASGFRATCEITLRRHAPVTLEVPGLGAVRASISWCRPGEFAATFDEPIDLDRAKFMSLNREAVLARLLAERARAHAAGREAEERDLRTQIRTNLPVRRSA